MENVRILARPEAYKLLTNPADSEKLKRVVDEAFRLARNKSKPFAAMIPESDFYIATRWAKALNQTSTLLIFCWQDQANKGCNPSTADGWETALQEAIPIPFFD